MLAATPPILLRPSERRQHVPMHQTVQCYNPAFHVVFSRRCGRSDVYDRLSCGLAMPTTLQATVDGEKHSKKFAEKADTSILPVLTGVSVSPLGKTTRLPAMLTSSTHLPWERPPR
jgi:hypothetical protein